MAEDWEKRAVLAVQEGRDDLAKQALLRHNEHVHAAVTLQETWVKHREETEKLKISLRQLNDKIEEAKRKKNILIARQKRAEAQQADPGDHVFDGRQQRLRDLRAHGRADRARGAQAHRRGGNQ